MPGAEKCPFFSVYCGPLRPGPGPRLNLTDGFCPAEKVELVNFFVFLTQEWLLVSTLAALIAVYAWRERIKSGRPISAHEVTRMLNSETGVLLDVRDKKEFNAGHISGAIHIPHTKVASELGQLEQYRDKTLVVADKIGQHAGSVGRTLGQNGFDVRRLSGGIAEWQAQSLPLIKS